jgi:hypothetical protein
MDLPTQYDVCGTALVQELAVVDQRRHVIEIPVVKYVVTEYETLSLRCAFGKLHYSEFTQ